jgi:hypothetical protein
LSIKFKAQRKAKEGSVIEQHEGSCLKKWRIKWSVIRDSGGNFLAPNNNKVDLFYFLMQQQLKPSSSVWFIFGKSTEM